MPHTLANATAAATTTVPPPSPTNIPIQSMTHPQPKVTRYPFLRLTDIKICLFPQAERGSDERSCWQARFASRGALFEEARDARTRPVTRVGPLRAVRREERQEEWS